MKLTNRGKNVLDVLVCVLAIAFFWVLVIVCGVAGQEMKQDRLEDGTGTIPPVSYTR